MMIPYANEQRVGPGAAAPLALFAALALLSTGCSVRRLAVNALADSLAASGDVFASDSDPELVRDAVPFALKTIEALLDDRPDHRGLLLSACQGFTQYAYAFVETDAAVLRGEDYLGARRLERRAIGLYLRARDYGLRSLDVRVPGTSERLRAAPEEALAAFTREEVPHLYWSGAAWGAALSLGKDRPELLADTPAVQALFERALTLDPGFETGAVHEAMIALEARPEAMGGSFARAREHFERAVALSRGRKASPYVSLAANVSIPTQDRAEFERLLGEALAVDPDRAPEHRLANLIAQRRARALLDRADELFLPEIEGEEEADGSAPPPDGSAEEDPP